MQIVAFVGLLEIASDMHFKIGLLFLLASGCSGIKTGDQGMRGSDSEGTSSSSTETAAGLPVSRDERLVRQLLDGERAVEEVLSEVAWGNGWPVYTVDKTWIFVYYGTGDWFLSGDFDDWSLEAMEQAGGFSWIEIAIPDPEGSRYKFTDGGKDWRADPSARSYRYDAHGEFSYVESPTAVWRLDRWPAIVAEDLLPRDLRVLVPAGSGPWPVLYMHDGQNLFGPGGAFGSWRVEEAVAVAGDMLVVGLDNTVDRLDEYTHVPDLRAYGLHGGRGDAYGRLLHHHVRPHIEGHYGSSGLNGVLGSSLGGLVSLHIGAMFTGEYDFVGSMSGTLGWGRFGAEEQTMVEVWLALEAGHTVVYADSGGGPGTDGRCDDIDGDGLPEDDPDTEDNYCTTRHFVDALESSGWTFDDDLFHWYEVGALHQESAWAARLDKPLQIFLDQVE